jgi:hypothetical protein
MGKNFTFTGRIWLPGPQSEHVVTSGWSQNKDDTTASAKCPEGANGRRGRKKRESHGMSWG